MLFKSRNWKYSIDGLVLVEYEVLSIKDDGGTIFENVAKIINAFKLL